MFLVFSEDLFKRNFECFTLLHVSICPTLPYTHCVLPGEPKPELVFSYVSEVSGNASGMDSIRNQHPKLRVMNFTRNFQGPIFLVWQKVSKLIPKFQASGNRKIFQNFGRKWITVYIAWILLEGNCLRYHFCFCFNHSRITRWTIFFSPLESDFATWFWN
jgi:hypothetical protein